MDDIDLEKYYEEERKVCFITNQIIRNIEGLGETRISNAHREHLCDMIVDGIDGLVGKYLSAQAASNSSFKKFIREALKSISDKLFSLIINQNFVDGRLLDAYDDINNIL